MSTAEERFFACGYENVPLLYAFDTALIGVTTDGRAVYDYDLMIRSLMRNEDMDHDEAVSWLEENTLSAMPNIGAKYPIVIEKLPDVEIKTGVDYGGGN